MPKSSFLLLVLKVEDEAEMSAKEHLFWMSGGMVLSTLLIGLSVSGWFFGMPARGLFVLIACVVMLPLAGDIYFHWQGWKRCQGARSS